MNRNLASDWIKIVADFRRCCLLRSRGHVAESEAILNEQLPSKIAAWSRTNSQDPAAQKAALEKMFSVEQQRVEDTMRLQELTELQWQQELAPALCRQISQEVGRVISQQFIRFEMRQMEASKVTGATRVSAPAKVPFADVPAVIDLLLAQEKPRALIADDCLMGS